MSDTSDFKRLDVEESTLDDERPFASWLPPLLSTDPTPAGPPATLTGLGPPSAPRATQGHGVPQSAPRATQGSALAETELSGPSDEQPHAEFIEPSDDDDDDDEPTRVITQLFPTLAPRQKSTPAALAPASGAPAHGAEGPPQASQPAPSDATIANAATAQSELLAQMVEKLAQRRPRVTPPRPPSASSASAPVVSAPVASAPVVSAPVVSAPVVSAPVASAPVASQAERTRLELAPEQVLVFEAAAATLAPPTVEYAMAESAPPAAVPPGVEAEAVPPIDDSTAHDLSAQAAPEADEWAETTQTRGAPPPPAYPPSVELSPSIERELPTAPASRRPTLPPSEPASARVTPLRSEPPWAATVGPNKTGKGRPAMRLMLGAFGASALVTVLVLRAFMPGKGTLLVTGVGANGTPLEQAQVFVDGKLACEPLPCRVGNIREGRHLVTVKAPGYQNAAEKPVLVDADNEGLVHFALAPENTAGLHVRVGTRGLRVFLDGEDRGEAPLTLGGLSPTEHTVRLAGSSAYSPFEQKIRLKPNETLTLTPELVPLQAFITVEAGSGAESATIEILGGPQPKAIVELPARIEVPLSGSYRVRATRSGFEPFETSIRFDDGEAEKRVRVELRPASAPGTTLPAGALARALPVVLEESPAAARPTATAPVLPAAAGTALNLSSTPQSSVIVNGRPVGATPQKVPIAAGTHSVVFVHPTLGRKTMTVKVEAGKTAAAAARF